MASIQTVYDEFGGFVCRRCINKRYKVKLVPRDCAYDGPYVQQCPNCKEEHHIVNGFSLTGKIKLMLK